MKKLLAILLLSVASIFSPVLSQDITGDGTAGTPYILYNAADFDSIRYLGYTKDYELANDIDFTSWGTFTRFPGFLTGHLDLAHHTITNLDWVGTFSGSDNDTLGLFQGIVGYTNGAYTYAHVRNGKFIDCNATVTGSPAAGNSFSYVGFLAGSVGSTGGTTYPIIDSLVFLNLVVDITASTKSNGTGYGAIMGSSGNGLFCAFAGAINRIHVEGQLLVDCDEANRIFQSDGVGGIVGYTHSAGSADMTQCAFIGRVVVTYITPPTANLGHYVGGLIGRPAVSSGSDWNLTDCYFRGTVKTQQSEAGGIIGHHTGGPLVISTSYTQVDTIVGWMDLGNDRDGLIDGGPDDAGTYTNCYADSESVLLDTLDAGTYDHTLRGVNEPIVVGTGLTTAQATDSAYYSGFDFDAVWGWNRSINDSYPYLLWYPLGTPIVLTLIEPVGGETYTWPDTLDILWTRNTSTDTLPYNLWYSLNNGLNWTFIDSGLVDTTYSWGFPNNDTNEALVLVTSRDSSGTDVSAVFNIISGPEINILYPINTTRTITVGDTTQVLIESANVDSLILFFSQDSTATWTLIAGVAIDTGNGFFYDTTMYVWTMNDLSIGDIYIKAITQTDTAIYFNTSSVTVAEIGSLLMIPPVYCTYDGLILTPLEYQIWEDPSCAWGTPSYTARTGMINDDATGYDIVTAPDPCDGACNELYEWSYRDPVYLVSGSDTTAYSMNEFYTNVDNDTLIYKNRRYWINPDDSCLYMDDMVNGLDSMKLADFTSLYPSYWRLASWTMQIYNVQYTKISGDTLDASLDFETLNNALFVPKIVIMAGGGAFFTKFGVTVTLLGAPNNQEFAEDIVLAYQDPTIVRYFFRGIHPKAEKR